MTSRYDGTNVFNNSDRIYHNIFKDRGVGQITQYGTRNLKYPSPQQMSQLTILTHVWAYGDQYYKLAHDSYGDPSKWWVIAFFNQKPTESDLRFGTVVYTPHPIERILGFYGV